MQSKIAIPFLLIVLFITSFAEAQVKIGDNPQVIDPASLLELESTDKVLVITRVDSLQMTTIVPNRGAMVYNTTADCIFYYDGAAWINMCGPNATGEGGPLTADPIVNEISTIVITPTANGDNLEIAPNSINSEQIINGGINGVDIQDGSIGPGKLQNNSVTQDKLSENSVGAFALDNDNVDLGDFTNNAGFITGADIISAEPGNVLTDNNGAFYDDSGLQTAIAANTTAIAADDDQSNTNEIQSLSILGNQLTLTGANTVTLPTADGSDTQINAGNNITITGNGTAATPYTINTPDQADPSITNELTDLDFDAGTNILTLTNPANATNQVDLSALAGGGGNPNDELITAAVLNASNELVITEAGTDTTVDLSSLAGGGGNQNLSQVLAEGNDANASGITNLTTDGNDATAAATVGFVNAAITTGGTPLTDGNILIGDAGDAAQQVVLSGDATLDNTGVLTIEDDAIDSDKIEDATILLEDLNANTASDDGDIIQWDTTENGGAGGWVVGANSGHTGTPKGIFFADENGDPMNPVHPINGNLSLIWDVEARVVAGDAYGALGVGLDGNPIAQNVKAHIEDIVIGDISYPLQIQNRSNTGATGIVFSVMGGSSNRGKGVLAFERNGANGIGDFHFLQDTNTDTGTADLGDKSFSILSDKNIRLYGNLITVNGAGNDGQVLTTNALGQTVWGNGSVITDVTLTGNGSDNLANALGIADDAVTAAKLAADVAGDGITQAADGSLEVDTSTLNGEGDITGTGITVGGGTDAAFGDVTLEITDDAVTAAKIAPDVAGNGITQAADGSLEVDTSTLNGEGDITGTGITVGGGTDATFGDVTLEITDDAVTAAKLAADVAGDGITQAADGSLEVDTSTLSGDGDITGTGITVGGGTDATFGDVTLEITDDAVTAAKLAADVAGDGITQAADGSLEVDTSTLSGDGDITGTGITVGGGTDATFGDVTLEITDDAVTPAKIQESQNASPSGEVLTTNGSDDVVWAQAPNIATTDLTLTANRTLDLAGNDLLFGGSGGIGIGTLPGDPLVKLRVNGQIRGSTFRSGNGGESLPAYRFEGDQNSGMFSAGTGELAFSTASTERIRIIADGKVGIGTDIPTEELHVIGDILASGTITPDYVFQKYYDGESSLKPSYKLISLGDVEKFVKMNKHLPGVPSAREVEKIGGILINRSTEINLEKIEELFLHTIAQEKEIDKLKTENKTLAKELATIKNDLEEIKSLLKKSE